MPFYRRRWNEARGDGHDDWGAAVYYFWVQDGVVEQQIEVYDSGVILAYDRYHVAGRRSTSLSQSARDRLTGRAAEQQQPVQ